MYFLVLASSSFLSAVLSLLWLREMRLRHALESLISQYLTQRRTNRE